MDTRNGKKELYRLSGLRSIAALQAHCTLSASLLEGPSCGTSSVVRNCTMAFFKGLMWGIPVPPSRPSKRHKHELPQEEAYSPKVEMCKSKTAPSTRPFQLSNPLQISSAQAMAPWQRPKQADQQKAPWVKDEPEQAERQKAPWVKDESGQAEEEKAPWVKDELGQAEEQKASWVKDEPSKSNFDDVAPWKRTKVAKSQAPWKWSVEAPWKKQPKDIDFEDNEDDSWGEWGPKGKKKPDSGNDGGDQTNKDKSKGMTGRPHNEGNSKGKSEGASKENLKDIDFEDSEDDSWGDWRPEGKNIGMAITIIFRYILL